MNPERMAHFMLFSLVFCSFTRASSLAEKELRER
jgi:hypothetical protein